ncbi:MAG: YhfC family intramembrane metalloprotease [Anaerolineales bacterium]|jgi:uncharacterized membrane protein YhfC|nr:YhfC family intramembrane metalloprotease [Anaerolineales bacterium]
MNILLITYPLNGLLMVGMPIALAIVLTRRFHYSWRLIAIGAATFVVSQIGHIPFNNWLNNLFLNGQLPMPPESIRILFFSLLGGLSAGLWEELARYGAFRWFAKEARSWGKGLLLGTGHGGAEAVLFGLLVLANFVVLASMRGQDASAFVTGNQATPELVAQAQAQINAYWSLDWKISLLGAVERLFALPFHLACSLLVMQVFTRQQLRWLWIAIAWHTAADAIPQVIINSPWGAEPWVVYAIEGVIGLLALASLGIILLLRQPEPLPVTPADQVPILPIEIKPVDTQPEDLNQTRYMGT